VIGGIANDKVVSVVNFGAKLFKRGVIAKETVRPGAVLKIVNGLFKGSVFDLQGVNGIAVASLGDLKCYESCARSNVKNRSGRFGYSCPRPEQNPIGSNLHRAILLRHTELLELKRTVGH
jgi:hypothetical protein